MSTPIDKFDYILPTERIAQAPAFPRESAKLMVVDRTTATLTDRQVSDLPGCVRCDDVLVINNTRVFKARLFGSIPQSGSPVELFLVRPLTGTLWKAIGKPGKKLTPGTTVTVAPDFRLTVTEKHEDGTFVVDAGATPEKTVELADTYGTVPVPPYIKTVPDAGTYQTSYAKITGSVAAPTAGFHLTPAILAELRSKGVTIVEITLHVGLGTFLPVKTDTLEGHTMHSEWVRITPDAARTITAAKREGRRIIAVGTTTVRTLEGVAQLKGGQLTEFEGDINLFITPGFRFSVIDGMMTNFHLPKSTLLVLVSAFAGHELTMRAYREAVDNSYRFYSFGDAMLII